MQIAVDGPAGSGKSTISKQIADKLEIEYIDTGAMYRAITFKALLLGIKPNQIDALKNMLEHTELDFKDRHIYLDHAIVDREIRDNYINQNVSQYAVIKFIRIWMVEKQQKIASNKDVIMDGRDIAAYVLPNATHKFYLTATAEERGNRRYRELLEMGSEITLEQVIKEIQDRDFIDSNRDFAPLKKADDAIEIDTTKLGISDVVNNIINHVNR